jgi:hypothetical protein
MNMTYIARKALSRRTLLRGIGVGLALPMLDVMVPAKSAAADLAAVQRRRLQIIYKPNGFIMENFLPQTTGFDYELTPTLKFAVVSGLDCEMAEPMGDGGGDHARASGTWLTGVHIRKSQAQVGNGISIDQIIANHVGKQTPLSSLELGLELPSLMGTCDTGYNCAYTNTISWSGPTSPLPMVNDPRSVFERMFGDNDSTDPDVRKASLRRQASILDFVMDDTAQLSRSLGANDRMKLEQYLDSVRSVEQSIQKAELGNQSAIPNLERPAAIPTSYEEYAHLMMDLSILALQTDQTRVASFSFAMESSGRSYPEIGVTDAHHAISHHGNNPTKMANVTKIDQFQTRLAGDYLDRISALQDGDRMLIDSTLVLFGAALADPNRHEHFNVPTVLAGGLVKGGQHIAAPKGTPITNLWLAMAETMGVREETLGDSNGRFPGPLLV